MMKKHEICIAWARSILADGNTSTIETVAQTPYSYVVKMVSDSRVYYLKKTPPDLFIEAKIIGMLGNYCPKDFIPALIAVNESEDCFLLESTGEITLRKHFDGVLDAALLVQGIQTYRTIQNKTSSHIQDFLNAGVADWRLSMLPQLYADFADNDSLLNKCGFTREECSALKNEIETFSLLCQKINTLNIPDALNHSDFQENNMVFDLVAKKLAIIDWGEVSIGHPLLPLIGCFKKTVWRYGLTPDNEDYHQLYHACFDGWGMEKNALQKIYAPLSAIDDIYYALTLVELMKNTRYDSPEWAARIKRGCLSFLNNCKA